ncbi:MAG: lactate utilization protein C [Lysinibacillus sp.]
MTITNRDTFLTNIARRLGRTPLIEKPRMQWQHTPQLEVLKHKTPDELLQILIEQCSNIHTAVSTCTVANLQVMLQKTIEDYGNAEIVYSNDPRFEQLGIGTFLKGLEKSYEWDTSNGHDNVQIAERANIGIVISDLTLAESGTIMVQTNEHVGRSLSYLPTNSIAIILKSTIVPRITQAAQRLRQSEQPVASSIHFITGPSNSADIEMNLVVGVHGPVKMTYIIVEDA